MKKIVLVFGLISGLILTAMMVYSSVSCYKNADYEGSLVLGYTGILVGFSFIFVGVKNYRDKYNGGLITFGKAFKTGLYITLIASTLYVGVWLIENYFFFPDWMDKYCTHMIQKAQTESASQVEVAKKTSEINNMKEMYKNPLFVVLFTYVEVLPIGLVISLISALILKRKAKVAMA